MSRLTLATMEFAMKLSTREDVERLAMWSSLPVYFVVWIAGLSTAPWPGSLFLGLVTASAYVAMHVYEMKCRGHCLLSADSTAVPLTIVLYGIGCAICFAIGSLTPRDGFSVAVRYGAVVICGHVAAILVAAVFTTILSLFVRSAE